MSKSQRDKGANWERLLAKMFCGLGYTSARRGIGQARSAKEVSDVQGTPFWVEAKVGAAPDILAAVRQAQAATDGRPVLVVTKRDREGVLVTMEWATFFAMRGGLPGAAGGRPAPGSTLARGRGCTCPQVDNGFGRGYLGRAGVFVHTTDCPVHAQATLPGLGQ